MLKFLRFFCAALLLVWLGNVITISFYVAPSLFSNQSGQVPNSGVAGEIITPLLHEMYATGWIAVFILLVVHGAIWKICPPRSTKVLLISGALLAAAWVNDLYAGTVLIHRIEGIRAELKKEFGGYHLAPKDNPERQRFGKLHGLSMMLAMLNLTLGFGSFFCVTQLMENEKHPEG